MTLDDRLRKAAADLRRTAHTTPDRPVNIRISTRRRHMLTALAATVTVAIGLTVVEAVSRDRVRQIDVLGSPNYPTAATHIPDRDPNRRYSVTGLVLENQEHAPQLCLGPQDLGGIGHAPSCNGLPIEGFSWNQIEGESSYDDGTTFADVTLVGTFDGTFHLTEPSAAPTKDISSSEAPPSLCTTSGDQPTADPDKVNPSALDALRAQAESESDLAGVWLTWPAGRPNTDRDYRKAVVNLGFTGDLERHQREAREVWGGGLCIGRLSHSRAELQGVQGRLDNRRSEAQKAGVILISTAVDEVHNVVRAEVAIADAAAQRWVDNEFGAGLVALEGAFKPVD